MVEVKKSLDKQLLLVGLLAILVLVAAVQSIQLLGLTQYTQAKTQAPASSGAQASGAQASGASGGQANLPSNLNPTQSPNLPSMVGGC